MKVIFRNIAVLVLCQSGLFAQTSAAGGQGQNIPPPAPPQAQPCVTVPPKKPGHFAFHLPKKVQSAVNKQLGKVEDKTGVAVDRNTPNTAIQDAEKQAQSHPCPAVSPTPTPAAPQR